MLGITLDMDNNAFQGVATLSFPAINNGLT
jgi:hypothetical protein